MRKAGKNLQKSDERAAVMIERRIRAEIDSEPERKVERFERYRRMLKSGTAQTFYVIRQAENDGLADKAIREHIAEMLDQGRANELSTQLRAYAVKYLVHPIEIMRQREG